MCRKINSYTECAHGYHEEEIRKCPRAIERNRVCGQVEEVNKRVPCPACEGGPPSKGPSRRHTDKIERNIHQVDKERSAEKRAYKERAEREREHRAERAFNDLKEPDPNDKKGKGKDKGNGKEDQELAERAERAFNTMKEPDPKGKGKGKDKDLPPLPDSKDPKGKGKGKEPDPKDPKGKGKGREK